MFAFQNPWIKPLIYFFSFSTATLGLFWPEITQKSIAAGQSEFSGDHFTQADFPKINRFGLRSPNNNAEELDTTEVTFTNSGGGAGFRISLRLENYGRSGTNDWPMIKVIYRDANGLGVRTEALAPSMYTHSGSLARSQTIEFTLAPRTGELNAMFEPYYPKKGAS